MVAREVACCEGCPTCAGSRDRRHRRDPGRGSSTGVQRLLGYATSRRASQNTATRCLAVGRWHSWTPYERRPDSRRPRAGHAVARMPPRPRAGRRHHAQTRYRPTVHHHALGTHPSRRPPRPERSQESSHRAGRDTLTSATTGASAVQGSGQCVVISWAVAQGPTTQLRGLRRNRRGVVVSWDLAQGSTRHRCSPREQPHNPTGTMPRERYTF